MCSGCFISVEAPKYVPTKTLTTQSTKKPIVLTYVNFSPSENHEKQTTEPTTTKPTPIVQPSVNVEPPKVEQEKTRYYDVPLSEDLQDHIFKLCKEHDIDPALVIAMIKRESNYKASAVGDKGNSLGLMQIQPRWHKARMDRLKCPDLLNPYQNVTVGIDILVELSGKGKPVEWVLMAYNGGVAYANRHLKAGTISSYASKVLDIRDNLEFKD